MNDSSHADLEHVRAELTAWRAVRKGHPRIPNPIWEAAIALLDRYPLDVLCRELKLKPAFVRKRLARSLPVHSAPSPFLDITPAVLAASDARASLPPPITPDPTYRLQIERADGARLSLHLPARDSEHLEAFLLAFARA